MKKKKIIKKMPRGSGVLLHISSLPSNYGIGTFGQAAIDFVDFLKEAGQTYWQILPLGTTGFGNSPYQNFSIHAGNPYFIDLDLLADQDLVERERVQGFSWGDQGDKVDYGLIYQNKKQVLEEAYQNFNRGDFHALKMEYLNFVEENDWLFNYAMFMFLKDRFQGVSWQDWPDEFRYYNRDKLSQLYQDNKEAADYYYFEQFLFFSQWFKLKEYACENGIKIIGDLPIYVALDSVDVWSRPEIFYLDEKLLPIAVAGCPPDYFTPEGQLWGNPLYNWEVMKSDGYAWWVDRVRHALKLFDYVRIDHFRGIEAYWSVPYGEVNAIGGEWVKGPRKKLFAALQRELGEIRIIAEDLGFLTDKVYALRNSLGLPGMAVLQFAFDPSMTSNYLPHNIRRNALAYTGTHDNSTLMGWVLSLDEETKNLCREYLGLTENDPHAICRSLMRTVMTTVANVSILPMQDLLYLDDGARINTPGKADNNWEWRLWPGQYEPDLATRLRHLTFLSGRLPEKLAECN